MGKLIWLPHFSSTARSCLWVFAFTFACPNCIPQSIHVTSPWSPSRQWANGNFSKRPPLTGCIYRGSPTPSLCGCIFLSSFNTVSHPTYIFPYWPSAPHWSHALQKWELASALFSAMPQKQRIAHGYRSLINIS